MTTKTIWSSLRFKSPLLFLYQGKRIHGFLPKGFPFSTTSSKPCFLLLLPLYPIPDTPQSVHRSRLTVREASTLAHAFLPERLSGKGTITLLFRHRPDCYWSTISGRFLQLSGPPLLPSVKWILSLQPQRPPKCSQVRSPQGVARRTDTKNDWRPNPSLTIWVKELCPWRWGSPREKIKKTEYRGGKKAKQRNTLYLIPQVEFNSVRAHSTMDSSYKAPGGTPETRPPHPRRVFLYLM